MDNCKYYFNDYCRIIRFFFILLFILTEDRIGRQEHSHVQFLFIINCGIHSLRLHDQPQMRCAAYFKLLPFKKRKICS